MSGKERKVKKTPVSKKCPLQRQSKVARVELKAGGVPVAWQSSLEMNEEQQQTKNKTEWTTNIIKTSLEVLPSKVP